MAAFCLLREHADKFIKGLRSGEIDPIKMASLSSEERHAFLSKLVGEDNAQNVNALFESKLLLKNQQRGLETWAKKVQGLTPETRRDLITKIGKLDKVLNPDEKQAFLKDLASTKIGADVTQAEAKQIFELSNKVKEAGANLKDDFTFDNEQDRLAYGQAKVELANYVSDLKGNDKITLKSFADVGGISKSIKASMDDSAIFRQGWKTMMTHPLTWQRNARKTFSDMVKTFGGKNVMDQIMADRESRPNELNGNYRKMGLAVRRAEEAYPTSIPEKIPVIGRAYKASENAYTGFVYRQRMDIADKYLQIAEDAGTTLNDKELKSIGSMVNSLTGRGNFGKFEGSAVDAANSIFFSPRNIKSQVDTLLHPLTGAGGSNFVRKEAAINLVKVAGGIAAIMAIANAVKPGSAETDPRSADFGKIRAGDTRFDISGGLSSLVTLAARIGPILAGQKGYSKSSTTGKLTEINARDKKGNPAFGGTTGKDVVIDYLTNKVAPVGQVIIDLLKQSDRNGKPLTLGGELSGLGVPLLASTYQDLKSSPNAANTLLGMIADGLGIAVNTYGANPSKTKTPKGANQDTGVTRDINRKVVRPKKQSMIEEAASTTGNLASTLLDKLIPTASASEGGSNPTQKSKSILDQVKDFFFPLVDPKVKSENVKSGDSFEQKGWIKTGPNQYKWPGTNKVKSGKETDQALTDIVNRRAEKVVQSVGKASQDSLRNNMPLIINALKDQGLNDSKTLAYALATIAHETANTFEPIRESGYLDKNQTPGTSGKLTALKNGYSGGADYYGRGFIQITNDFNYKKYGEKLGIDLVKNPDKALDPNISAKILALYFKERGTAKLASEGKFMEARGTVNNDSNAKLISDKATEYYKMLTSN